MLNETFDETVTAAVNLNETFTQSETTQEKEKTLVSVAVDVIDTNATSAQENETIVDRSLNADEETMKPPSTQKVLSTKVSSKENTNTLNVRRSARLSTRLSSTTLNSSNQRISGSNDDIENLSILRRTTRLRVQPDRYTPSAKRLPLQILENSVQQQIPPRKTKTKKVEPTTIHQGELLFFC